MQDDSQKDVFIGEGELSGKGVYAGRDFKEEEVVIKYNLHSLTPQEFERLSEEERQFTHTHHGIINLYSEPERYVNHSDSPNTYQDFEKGADIALMDIKKGEMITTDARKDDV